MLAKREQLTTDAPSFVATLVQGLQSFLHNSPHACEPCTIALTARAAQSAGPRARLAPAGFHRILRLPAGAAACGAARIGESRLKPAEDLSDVPVETAVPLRLAPFRRRAVGSAAAKTSRLRSPRPAPTHAILEGIGHAIGTAIRVHHWRRRVGADVALPDAFGSCGRLRVPLVREGDRLWFVDSHRARPPEPALRRLARAHPD